MIILIIYEYSQYQQRSKKPLTTHFIGGYLEYKNQVGIGYRVIIILSMSTNQRHLQKYVADPDICWIFSNVSRINLLLLYFFFNLFFLTECAQYKGVLQSTSLKKADIRLKNHRKQQLETLSI